MGLVAIETVVIYLVIPYMIYLIYLYNYPITKKCSFCEKDSLFHRCLPNTGRQGKFCYDFTTSDDYLKRIVNKHMEITINTLKFATYSHRFFLMNILPTSRDLLLKYLDLINIVGPVLDLLQAIGFKCVIFGVDPCSIIANGLNKVMSTIFKACSKALDGAVDQVKKEVLKPLSNAFEKIFKSLEDVFGLVSKAFDAILGFIGQITKPLFNILGDIASLSSPSSLRNIIFAVIGIFAVGIIIQILLLLLGLMFMYSVPAGGLLGSFKIFIYSTLYLINQIYLLFDIDIRESPIVVLLEAML